MFKGKIGFVLQESARFIIYGCLTEINERELIYKTKIASIVCDI